MNDPLFGNKIAFSLLAAALLLFGLPQVADALFGGGHGGGHGGELHLAYPVEFETSAPADAAAPAADLGVLLAAANPASGERRAGLCKTCHTFEQGGANGTGPNLYGIVGRPVATVPGFSYTAALKTYGGEWTYERLNEFIKNSQASVPGTAMVQRFPKDDQRADILAYLSTLAPTPLPFPEPAMREDAAAVPESESAEAAAGQEGSPATGEPPVEPDGAADPSADPSVEASEEPALD